MDATAVTRHQVLQDFKPKSSITANERQQADLVNEWRARKEVRENSGRLTVQDLYQKRLLQYHEAVALGQREDVGAPAPPAMPDKKPVQPAHGVKRKHPCCPSALTL